MSGRSDIEQSIVNHLKVARNLIRMKHAINADNEINDMLPKLRVQLEAAAQRGELPALSGGDLLRFSDDIEAAISGTD